MSQPILNRNLQDSVNYLSLKMPSVSPNHPNPVETLNVEDITYLQKYLENIKQTKMRLPRPVDRNPYTPRPSCSRIPVKMDEIKKYNNPYEYGAKQNTLKPTYLSTYQEQAYAIDPSSLTQMGVPKQETNYPTHIRNMDIESCLLQRESTRLPGQREITEKEVNRFELLPFDPQDHRHIVWRDDMPRGGYATRNDRLEIQ